MPLRLCSLAMLLGVAAPPQASPGLQPTAHKSIRAARSEGAMTIDGRADEEVWSRSELRTDFLERQPRLEHPPNFDVALRVAYDDLNLYVFVETSKMGRPPRVRSLRRDGDGLFRDDWVGIKIDPLHDRRTSYNFFVNADGAQTEMLGLDDGRTGITQWDAVWQAATEIHEDGYSVEYAIPFYVLGVRPNGDQTMGFNVSIGDVALAADIDWSVIKPPMNGISASQHGDLVGLSGVPSSRAIELIPFFLARSDFERRFSVDPRRAPNLQIGGDMRIKIGAGSYVEATALTDFAQVNADQVQVAQDRFPLFFPEQRPFFLNGLDVLAFGRPGEAQLFFSRRIGLDAGLPVPVASGVKIYGRNDALTYAALNVQTLRTFPDPELPEDEPGGRGSPAENFTVGRIRSQLGESVAVGGIAMGKAAFATQDTPGTGEHFSGGVDAELRLLDSKLRAYGFGATTWNERLARPALLDPETDQILAGPLPRSSVGGASGYAAVEYRGLYVRPQAWWLWSDEDFDPRMGFYRRPGTAIQAASLTFAPRPRMPRLQEITFGPAVDVTTDPDYERRLTRNFGGNLAFNFSGGARIDYAVREFVDEVQADFVLYGHRVPAETYRGLRNRVSLQSPVQFALGGSASAEHGDLFGGQATILAGGVDLRPVKYFALSGGYTHLFGQLGPGQDFDFGFANGAVELAVNPNLSLDNLVRLNLEPGSERFGLQSRLRWRYLPGSDLFLVYRNGIPLGDGPEDPTARAPQPFHELIVRLNFYFRALIPRRGLAGSAPERAATVRSPAQLGPNAMPSGIEAERGRAFGAPGLDQSLQGAAYGDPMLPMLE